MATTDHPPSLANPFSTSTSSTTYTTSSTTYSTSSSTNQDSPTSYQNHKSNMQKSQSSAALNRDSPTTLHRSKTDGRRNSFGETLPSPTENWKPTFSRVQSWNREDRKREIVLKREIAHHEGHGGGFSEKC